MVSIDNTKLILSAFFHSPSKPQYIRQITSNCELSYERVQHYLKELEKLKVLRSETKGKIKEYTINKKHELVLKIFSILEMEKRQMFFSKNPQFQAWLANLSDELSKNLDKSTAEIPFILLFGSTARGDARAGSDVDILVVARKIDLTLKKTINRQKAKLEALSGKVFSFHLVDYSEFADKWKKEPVYATIWLDKIILFGEENFWRKVLDKGEPL